MVGIKRASVSAALLLSIAERTMANPVDIEDLMLRADDDELLEAREVASDLDHLLLQMRDLEIRKGGVEHHDPTLSTRGWVRSVFGEGLEEREVDTIVDTMLHLRELESRQSSPVLASQMWSRGYAVHERDFDDDLEERDLEDLEERDFDELDERYFDELDERDFEDFEERYFDELDERDKIEERDAIEEREPQQAEEVHEQKRSCIVM
jgi:uncharacterized protein YeaO (DUF488 family)